MKEFYYTVTDPAGIHARPAGEIVRAAEKYCSEITIVAGDKTADAKKLMRLMGLGAKRGTDLTVCIEGKDEEKAAKELYELFQKILL